MGVVSFVVWILNFGVWFRWLTEDCCGLIALVGVVVWLGLHAVVV